MSNSYCTNCGKELPNGTAFCVNCGTKVETGTVDTAMPSELLPHAKSTKKRWRLIIGIIAGIVVITGGGLFAAHTINDRRTTAQEEAIERTSQAAKKLRKNFEKGSYERYSDLERSVEKLEVELAEEKYLPSTSKAEIIDDLARLLNDGDVFYGVTIKKATTAIDENDFHLARAVLNSALNEYPNNVLLTRLSERITSKYNDTRAEIDDVLNNSEYLLYDGQFDLAIANLEEALRKYPNDDYISARLSEAEELKESSAMIPNASATPAPSYPSNKYSEPVAITLGLDTYKDIPLQYEAIRAFSSAYPNVTVNSVEFRYSSDGFPLQIAGGTVPTVFTSWYSEVQKLIKSGYVRDISAILKARGWYDKMNPSLRDWLSKDGKIYGVPRDGYALGLMLNVELFEQAGLMSGGIPKYPKTWVELAETARIIKEKTGSAGICLLGQDNAAGWHFSNIAWSFGATLVTANSSGKYTANINSPEAVAAMEFLKSLKWTYDVLTTDPLSENWGTGFTQLGTGGAAMYIGANDSVDQPTSNNGLPADKLALVPIPAGTQGQYSLSGGTPYLFLSSASDAEVNAALDYLVMLGNTPERAAHDMDAFVNDVVYRKDSGIPIIKRFPVWHDTPLATEEDSVINTNSNTNADLYTDYFAAVLKPGNLRMEEPGLTQDLYGELTRVIQECVTNKNADVKGLMHKANENLQKLLNDAGIGR